METRRSPAIVAGEPARWGKSTVVTGAKGYVLLGGAIGIDMDTAQIPQTMREQTKKAMENIKEALEECGAPFSYLSLCSSFIQIAITPRYSSTYLLHVG